MDLNFSAFQEPRGVMRILHLIFSICAFATITGFAGQVALTCISTFSYDYSYPFQLALTTTVNTTKGACAVDLSSDFSSDAKFFVATGVLAMLYSIAIMVVYAKFDEKYKTNNQLPLVDFIITVIFGVLWLSSSAAWANGLAGLKRITEYPYRSSDNGCEECTSETGSFSTLNISVIFGFLNFFLWAADLWFLYKETAWFQGNQPQTTSGV